MGLLVDGAWQDRWYDTASTGGRFVRKESQFRNWVTADGSPGPTGAGGFKAEPGRYHLYVSLACPWAHRTLVFRAIKGLSDMISVSVTHWRMLENGWTFAEGPGVVPDALHGSRFLYEVYLQAQPIYSGRVTVPVLWDKATGTIVNNESAEIIRMFNSAFNGIGAQPGDYYPADLRDEIDALNARIYDTVNNGVYKAGFATAQDAYDEAVAPLFGTLDWLDERLATRRYLCGERLTEADWRLHHPRAFRCGLCRPLQVQPAPHRRLPEPVGLPTRSVPDARRRRDREHAAHQGPLLREPPHHQSKRDRAARAGDRLPGSARAGISGVMGSARISRGAPTDGSTPSRIAARLSGPMPASARSPTPRSRSAGRKSASSVRLSPSTAALRRRTSRSRPR
jgi:putative glutathione S-transferase